MIAFAPDIQTAIRVGAGLKPAPTSGYHVRRLQQSGSAIASLATRRRQFQIWAAASSVEPSAGLMVDALRLSTLQNDKTPV